MPLMKTQILAAPVLKWAGGKRQLLNALQPLFPKHIDYFCEPFLGGAAVLFHLMPEKAWINDINEDLMLFYLCLRDQVDELIALVSTFKNEEEDFYKIRSWDRDEKNFLQLSAVQRAARLLYLNKTCYNGLYRVNKRGLFNTPYGHYKKTSILDEHALRIVSSYLNSAQITMTSRSYIQVLNEIPENTFVYLDPPYAPLTETANFISYSKNGFSTEDQICLKEQCDLLTKRNIKFMLSNSSADFIKSLYSDYNITTVYAKRAINSNALKRGVVDEFVIRNYE